MAGGQTGKFRRRARAGLGTATLLAATVVASSAAAPPEAANTPLPTTGGANAMAGLLSADAPGVNSGLSPRLAALTSLSGESKRDQAAAMSLRPRGPGSLQRDGNRIVANARLDATSPSLIDDLRASGAEILSVNDRYGTVDLAARPGDFAAIARVPGVAAVTEAIEPIVASAQGGATLAPAGKPASSGRQVGTCTGSRVAEGETQMRVAAARQQFNVDGTGQTVGIVSDSFDVGSKSATRASQDIASGDLPGPGNPCGRTTPVQVIAEGQDTDIDEGRGMAQIVHDHAPGAVLQFAESGASADAMADNIRALRAAGSTVITDDITFFDEPFFQEGPIANAATDVTAAGVPFYSSAANSNVIVNGQNVGSYEAPNFRLSGDCLTFADPTLTGQCMDFNPAAGAGFPQNDNAFNVIVNPGSSFNMNLQWAEPRNGVKTDFDAFVFDFATGQFVFSGTTDSFATQKPFELVNIQNPRSTPSEFGLVIYRKPTAGAGTPRLKFTIGRSSLADIQTTTAPDVAGPTIFGHNGSLNSISTAAIPYDDASKPENFSSRGPVVNYFGPVSGTTPAAALPSPQVMSKPDIAATDNVQTTFFIDNSSGVYRFSGTSAAAPAAAAIAALQKSANPFLSPQQILAAQRSTAVPVGAFGPLDVGAGLIDAVAAIGANPPIVPNTTITKEPKRKVFKKSVTYKFTSDVPGSSFICQIDRSKPVGCAAKVRVKRLSYGKHRFRVAAVFNGQVDPSPAKDKFKRKRKRGR